MAPMHSSESSGLQRPSFGERSTARRPTESATATVTISSGPEWVTESSNGTAVDMGGKRWRKDARAVFRLRVLVVLSLLSAAATVATLTFHFVNSFEQDLFSKQYTDSATMLARFFQRRVSEKVAAARTISAMYTSRFANAKPWPNATIGDFEEQAKGQLFLSEGRALSFNPVITQGPIRDGWEAHAAANADLLGADQLVHRQDGNRIVADGIFRKSNGQSVNDSGLSPESLYPDVLVPVWQIAPIEGNAAAVMFNLHSQRDRQRALDDMIKYKIATLTAILQLVQDTEERPSSILFYPVLSSFDQASAEVVGSISIVFSWDDVFKGSLPTYIEGVIIVLETNFDQSYTFAVSGGASRFLGRGDLHDTYYDGWRTDVQASLSGDDMSLGLGVADGLVTYSARIYPSSELKRQYVTTKPLMYTVVVLLIFICTSAVFMVYDYLVQHRTYVLTKAATTSSMVVDGLFPQFVRKRVLKQQAAAATPKHEAHTPALRLRHFCAAVGRTSSKRKSTISSELKMDRPIADVFPEVTVFFADLAGFTAWSSGRPPEHVFQLLERLYAEFDERARRHKVFKVETIGDCYMAVTGLPDPQPDHAVLMAEFALDCRQTFADLKEEMVEELGPTVEDLQIRVGMHSGQVTAGVLRGQKSRFQLFGDTVNTASRMESTGIPTRIQVSETTATCLQEAGLSRWLTPRSELVAAKGKGELQTYWLDSHCGDKHPQDTSTSFSVGPIRSPVANSAPSDMVAPEATPLEANPPPDAHGWSL